ncbi:MAG: DUF6326 family protein [Candidatus Bathyarchaeota archaeon]|nr:DUF6326 family protein [Candidatus Bathyarchaeota archaeon]
MLWFIYEVVGLAHVMLALMEPGAIGQIMAGEAKGMKIGPEFLLLSAILILVPFVMAFLSLTLKDSTNRWGNVIVGIVFTGLGLTDLPTYLAKPSAYAVLMWLSTVVATALIVWYAWTSKKQV